MKILAWIVGGVVAGAAALWLIFALSVERAITTWLDARAAEGWAVSYDAIDTGGFPTAFDTTFDNLSLADPATGWAWRTERFSLTQAAWRPDRLRVTWPEPQMLASPFERLTVSGDAIWTDLDVQPARRFALDASHTMMENLQIDSNLGGQAGLGQGELRVMRLPGQTADYDIRFEATDLRLPAAMTAQLDPAGVLPEAIEIARYEARMAFDRPWDLGALEDARPQITELALGEMRAQWGPLLIRASGDLVVDDMGRASGEMAVRAENWRDLLDLSVRAGALRPAMRGPAERALGFVAGLSGRPEDIDATLRLDEGFVFFGPLPIGEAPRLLLR